MAKQPSVAIYCRVSTCEQNPDSQLHDLREHVRGRGWHGVTEYVDIGESGMKDSRPAFDELWAAILRRRVNILVVHALDRLGRSLPHLVKIVSELAEQRVTLISFRENFDLSTAQGRMLAGIFSVLADYELNMIRERTRAGMRAAKARGRQVGNRMRFFDKQKATELRDAGWGQIRIARALEVGVGRVNEWVKFEYVAKERREKVKAEMSSDDR